MNLQEALQVARDAAKVGAVILAKQYDRYHVKGEKLNVSTKTSDIDVVTEIDGLAQKAIIAEIQKHFPDHRFIAEEEGADALGDPESSFAWIIDPLDGTQNFIHGKNLFGSIVALMENEEIVVGAMDLPLTKERYHGGKGLGAFFNDHPVKLRKTKGMTDAVLASNIMHRAKKRDDGTYYVNIPYCASIENSGCAADELGQILQGHADGAFFDGIKIWDVATGFVLLKEAGGDYRFRLKEKGNWRGGLLCAASTKPIIEDLWNFVQTRM